MRKQTDGDKTDYVFGILKKRKQMGNTNRL